MKLLRRRRAVQSPVALPKKYSWARDEIVRLRLENDDLKRELTRLRMCSAIKS